jgi:phosphatidylethanolamine-binding protein (PEBP) family uncharacterized protein
MTRSRSKRTTPALLAAVAIALAGCSNSSDNAPAPTAAASQAVNLAFGSSAIRGSTLPALYTCDGRNVSPPLTWGPIPSGVDELALFAVGVRSVGGKTLSSIEWAMAGMKPGLHGLRAGEIPGGAFLLTDSDGAKRYSICPGRGQAERFVFALLALPRGARASPRIPGTALLRNLTQSTPEYEAPASGAFAVTYKRT